MKDQEEALPPPAPPPSYAHQTRDILKGKPDSQLAQEVLENLNSLHMDVYNKKASDQRQSHIPKFFKQQLVVNPIKNISVVDNSELMDT